MSRLTWGAPGERYFEKGVDRGVLYVGASVGVPWTGLISVSESPNGGQARAFYQDGIKYLNLSSKEEFEATITAFAAPKEFAPCDGMSAIQNGLFATQQPRKPFNLTYRTLVGNDTDGETHGYKIHFVYNALTAPASRDNKTTDDGVDLNTLSWSITTVPPKLTGLKPTAHFIVDSRYTDPFVLTEVENRLYGTDEFPATFPTYEELTGFFTTTFIEAGDADDTDPVVFDGGSPSSTFTTYIDGGSL